MRIAFVLRGYQDRPYRTLAAVFGVALPVVSMLIQLGFYDAVMTAATHFYRSLRFDVLLLSPDYLEFSQPGSIPRASLARSRAIPGVRATEPVFIGVQSWRVPRTERIHQILVLGIDPWRNPFEAIPHGDLLERRDTLLYDRYSRPALGTWTKGMVAEVGGKALDVAGTFAFGAGFSALGLCVVSDRTFDRLSALAESVPPGASLVPASTSSQSGCGANWRRTSRSRRAPRSSSASEPIGGMRPRWVSISRSVVPLRSWWGSLSSTTS